jgi:hypothetical protein
VCSDGTEEVEGGACELDRGRLLRPRERTWFGDVTTWHHRTVENHVRAGLTAGFVPDTLSESEPSARTFADQPDELRRRRRVPLILEPRPDPESSGTCEVRRDRSPSNPPLKISRKGERAIDPAVWDVLMRRSGAL